MATLRGVAQSSDCPLIHTLLAYWRSLLACVLSTGTPKVAAKEAARHNASRYGFFCSGHLPHLQKLTLQLPPSPCRCPLRAHRRSPHRGGVGTLASPLE